MRGASASIRSRQSERQRIIERLTIVDPNRLRYSVAIDDAETYMEPWEAAFEYACHEGNYSVPNALNGARVRGK